MFAFTRQFASVLGFLIIVPQFCAQEPSPADKKKIKALEAERAKLTNRLAEIDAELRKLRPPLTKPIEVVRIPSFLGISSDFKAYARLDGDGRSVRVVHLETGRKLTSPAWDRDWGEAASVMFGKNVIAVISTSLGGSAASVKVFSQKTGELEQNVRDRISRAALTPNGRFLAMCAFRSGTGKSGTGSGTYLVLRDLQGKKTLAEWRLGGGGYISLAVAANRVAVYESRADQITVVEAQTGKW
jgi:hypothetical protein